MQTWHMLESGQMRLSSTSVEAFPLPAKETSFRMPAPDQGSCQVFSQLMNHSGPSAHEDHLGLNVWASRIFDIVGGRNGCRLGV